MDVEAFNLTDYFDIIKNPMNLLKVESYLLNKKYELVEDFLNDI